MTTVRSPLVVALDYHSMAPVVALAERLDPSLCRLKVGKELFTACGPQVVEKLQSMGFELFLDLKFHDIPNTVAQAVKSAAELGVWMVNVHASGGRRMMEAAREALVPFSKPPLLIAVTVLTSMNREDLRDIGLDIDPRDQVLRLARLTQNAGLDGVVCSAWEAMELKSLCGAEFKLVTPGIRLPDSAADDQRRVMTPAQAVSEGADYLVMGRPITQAADPIAVLEGIAASLAG